MSRSNGEANRKARQPGRIELEEAFARLGTQTAVAERFGVTRATILTWALKCGFKVASHPEIGRARVIERLLADPIDRARLAQWLIDEGTVSVSYDTVQDTTRLVVAGGMTDVEAMSRIAGILNAPVTNAAVKFDGPILPVFSIVLRSAEAYAVLRVLQPELVGLKADEAKAALAYFPPSGYMRGRHTTDEFLIAIWRDFATRVVHRWNAKKKMPLDGDSLAKIVERWMEGRINRARRNLIPKYLRNSSEKRT